MTASVYSALASRLQAFTGETYKLHVGDTWMEPAVGCRMEDLHVDEYPGMHRYASIKGRPDLVTAICERYVSRTGLATSPSEVLIGAGATGALASVVRAIMAPGKEVLLLAPYWPLVSGIVTSFYGKPVPVPFFGEVATPQQAVAAVAAKANSNTVALYLNTPSNPTGKVLPRPILEALVGWARKAGVWLLADEVYEDYVYEGEHVYTRPLAPERTFSIHSFSKAYGMAGNRCGYVIGPANAIAQVQKASTYTFYSTPTAAQIAGVRALGPAGDAWVAAAKNRYAEVGREVAKRLGVAAPQGCTFVFLDIADTLKRRGQTLMAFLEGCADIGLLVAPGPSFGPYPTHIRVCFTSEPPEVTLRGVDKLRALLG